VRDVFWVIPNHLGGRPGPNLYPWNERDLHDAGIRTILSVNDGEWVNVEALESLGIAYRCYPLSDTAPPRPGDIEHCQRVLPLAFEFVEAQLSQGRTTRSGRSGQLPSQRKAGTSSRFRSCHLSPNSGSSGRSTGRVIEPRPHGGSPLPPRSPPHDPGDHASGWRCPVPHP